MKKNRDLKKIERYLATTKGLKSKFRNNNIMGKTALAALSSLAVITLTPSISSAQCVTNPSPDGVGSSAYAGFYPNGGSFDVNGDGTKDVRFGGNNAGTRFVFRPYAQGIAGGNAPSSGAFPITLTSGQVIFTNNYGISIVSAVFVFNLSNTTDLGFAAVNIDGSVAAIGTTTQSSVTWNSFGCPAAAMPVELISFATKESTKQIALHWQTASETNNAGFEIQRSMDGKNFENLDFIEGKGTTQEQQDYVYDDKNLRQGQTYYYRLKQIDFDGGFEYSEVITARTAGQEVTGVFAPNPAVAGQTVLSYSTPEAGEMVLRVFDVAGKELLRQVNVVEEGSNRFELNFSDLGTGLFFVKMEQGGQTAYEKVVVE